MKRLTIVSMLCLCLLGCTTGATKVAMTAVETADRQRDSIQENLVTLAGQMALDRAGAETTRVGANQASILEKLKTDLDKIAWLDKEWVKARLGPGAIVQRYVWSQQGFLSVLFDDWEEAKAATQPAQ